MKKMLLAATLALLITGCAQQTFAISKQTGSSSTKETITIILHSGIGQKTVDAAQNLWQHEKYLLKQSQQTFVNGLLGFITLGIYTPLEAILLLLTIIA